MSDSTHSCSKMMSDWCQCAVTVGFTVKKMWLLLPHFLLTLSVCFILYLDFLFYRRSKLNQKERVLEKKMMNRRLVKSGQFKRSITGIDPEVLGSMTMSIGEDAEKQKQTVVGANEQKKTELGTEMQQTPTHPLPDAAHVIAGEDAV